MGVRNMLASMSRIAITALTATISPMTTPRTARTTMRRRERFGDGWSGVERASKEVSG
jgi:hypothetical protein